MTTTIIVQAHCDPATKAVQMVIKNDPCSTSPKEFVDIVNIYDGEEKEIVVYDDKSVTIKEVEKE